MPRESNWTAPRVDCPSPECWSAPDRKAAEAEVAQLLGALCRALRPDLALETGSYLGHTAQAIGSALDHGGHLDTLETDPGCFLQARERTVGLPVEVHLEHSLVFVPDRPLDFVFFDADIELRKEEMARYRDFASPRCVWTVHDAHHHLVRDAVNELEEAGIVSASTTLPTPRGLAIGRYRAGAR